MSVLAHSNNINFEVCHRVLSQSVYTLLSLIQALLNMSTLSTNDQGKSFLELVYGSVNQVLVDHRRWHQLWRSPFQVTLQRIFNTRLKNCRLLFFAVISEHFGKKHDYICSGYKNMVSQKCAVFIGPPCRLYAPLGPIVPRTECNRLGQSASHLWNITVSYFCEYCNNLATKICIICISTL